MFTIGIGPSSSHTVGPMKAAASFLEDNTNAVAHACRISVCCYGSLGLTGQGHGTDKALMLGLMGFKPDNINPKDIPNILSNIKQQQQIKLLSKTSINFNPDTDLNCDTATIFSYHSNAMRFEIHDKNNNIIASDVYYSVGGGFIEKENDNAQVDTASINSPYPFTSAKELLNLCHTHNLSIANLIMANEKCHCSTDHINQYLNKIIDTMMQTIKSGMSTEGVIPNRLMQKRRAPKLAAQLKSLEKDRHHCINHLTCYAIAVGEQNAAGEVVVTSPTNGAAGIIPAVLMYYVEFLKEYHWSGDLHCFLLTAGGIGSLYKMNASISGAEMGCQGEVGVACSMAAGGLAAAMGGSPLQVEHAAEIAMEHNLGLTCDPVLGLVQIPCIERNAMAAVKSLNAALLALSEDGSHYVTLDQAIETMRQVGEDMQSKYKETALGGLASVAINVVEC